MRNALREVCNIDVSKSTLSRTLKRAGFSRMRLSMTSFLVVNSVVHSSQDLQSRVTKHRELPTRSEWAECIGLSN
ncbi:hypothetical protein BS17DRAFT_860880 [Gyrodon lividus]|nr:hypothetical protein BS17DRAFT_860880 [Gyrodon lividus]